MKIRLFQTFIVFALILWGAKIAQAIENYYTDALYGRLLTNPSGGDCDPGSGLCNDITISCSDVYNGSNIDSVTVNGNTISGYTGDDTGVNGFTWTNGTWPSGTSWSGDIPFTNFTHQ